MIMYCKKHLDSSLNNDGGQLSSATQFWADYGLRAEERKYDSLTLTVIFLYGRVVQNSEMLSDSRSASVCFCFCFARYSAQLRGT